MSTRIVMLRQVESNKRDQIVVADAVRVHMA